jgi:hypothetical protein
VLVVIRVISIEKCVLETLFFGLSFIKLKLRTRQRFQLSAPFNARCDRYGRICHDFLPLARSFERPSVCMFACRRGLDSLAENS